MKVNQLDYEKTLAGRNVLIFKLVHKGILISDDVSSSGWLPWRALT